MPFPEKPILCRRIKGVFLSGTQAESGRRMEGVSARIVCDFLVEGREKGSEILVQVSDFHSSVWKRDIAVT
jgi:hypothetical protein